MSNRARKSKLHHHNHHHHNHHNRFSFTFIFVIAAVSLFCINRHQQSSSMINYTAVAATAFNMPKIGLGTMSIRPSEAAPVIVSILIWYDEKILYNMMTCITTLSGTNIIILITARTVHDVHTFRTKLYLWDIDYLTAHQFISMKRKLVMLFIPQQQGYPVPMFSLHQNLLRHSIDLSMWSQQCEKR